MEIDGSLSWSHLDVVAGYIAPTTSIAPDSTVIAFQQYELCFHVLFCYQMPSESGETAIVSCKHFHNRKVLEKACLLF